MIARANPVLGVLFAAVLLAGCESVEDQVDRLYSEAQALAESGESEKARLLLKNLFDLDGFHRDARLLYADQSVALGDLQEAYRHYLLVAEQNPEYGPVREDLAQLALEANDWDEAARHLGAAENLGYHSADLSALRVALDYRQAVGDNDTAAMQTAGTAAEALLEETPELVLMHRVLLDMAVRSGDPYGALERADTALSHAPSDPEINRIKLGLLAQTEQMGPLGAHLKVLVETFPEDETYRTNLVTWYLSNDDAQGAEDFLRGLIDPTGEDPQPQFALVQFLNQIKGSDAALAELDKAIPQAPNALGLERMRAAILFDSGQVDQAVAKLESLIEANAPSNDRRDLQVTLARMLLAKADTDAAKALIAAVLSEDDRHVDALVMNAAWLIEDDQVRDAILSLRTALDQSPENVAAINMLAAAYERDGNRDLMGEALLLATTTSNFAPAESLRYARFLISRDKPRSAEDVLIRSLRLHPGHVEMLQGLGETYLMLSDWGRAEQVVATLNALEDTPRARDVATGLQATLLARMQRTDDSIELLRGVIAEGRGGAAAHAAVVRTHLAQGNVAEARLYLDEALASAEAGPDMASLRFLDAALMVVEGEVAQAQAIYRDLLDDTPGSELVWRALIATALRQRNAGEDADVEAMLDEALAALPGSPSLLWIKASLAEQSGDIDTAISIYEDMYALNSSSSIVANNLASLITTHRTDPESLQRAYVIARRLRGSTLPAFQDTYGWIAYRMGNLSEAVEHLEPAAKGLPEDPLVQYHLGKAFIGVGRLEEARTQFDRALDLWGESETPQKQDALRELEKLAVPTSATPSE